jgi:hypothetical protein
MNLRQTQFPSSFLYDTITEKATIQLLDVLRCIVQLIIPAEACAIDFHDILVVDLLTAVEPRKFVMFLQNLDGCRTI